MFLELESSVISGVTSPNDICAADMRMKLVPNMARSRGVSPPTWRLHTKLYNFARNISTNISTLGQHTYLTLGELSSLFIVYNITISWLHPLHGFWFYFLLRDDAHTLSQFLQYEGTKSISTPRPGWDASPSQGYPKYYVRRYPFVHLGGERHCVLPKNTT